MTDTVLAPRNAYAGVFLVWGLALIGALVLCLALPEAVRAAWVLIAFGLVILLSFAVQLGYGRVEGFIVRVAVSMVGALLLMGLVSAGFGLAALAPAL